MEKKKIKVNYNEPFVLSLIVAVLFTIGFIFSLSIKSILITFVFSSIVFILSFLGFGCCFKIIFDGEKQNNEKK